MTIINNIKSRQILDSRGIPTIEVDVLTSNNIIGRASIPSGSSTGKYEAFELRDNKNDIFLGKSVLKSISNINNIISPELIGKSVLDQTYIDNLMIKLDGTKNKTRLGANSILAVSLAVSRAAGKELKIPLYKYMGGIYTVLLPIPLINIINGGKHSNSSILFQEFMIVPLSANTFSNAVHIGYKIFYTLKDLLNNNGFSTNVGDEGGFSPQLNNIEEVLKYILDAIYLSKYEPYYDVGIAIDCAASEFYENGKYNYSKFSKIKNDINIKSSKEHAKYLSFLVDKYPIISIEDGMDQDDFCGWQYLTNDIGDKIQLVGDDLFVTQKNRLKIGIQKNIANSILIKLNQVGTLTETIETIELAKKNNYQNIISHRSGETEDSFISNLSVAFNIEQIKIGSLCRSERISKYNELLRIEESIKHHCYYPKWNKQL